MAGGAGAVDPPLDPKLLPFSKGPLSFGVGVNLKMAVSRWTDWAHDAGVREEKGVLEGLVNHLLHTMPTLACSTINCGQLYSTGQTPEGSKPLCSILTKTALAGVMETCHLQHAATSVCVLLEGS